MDERKINIMRAVALKYNLDDAELLEVGSFKQNQIDILLKLCDDFWKEPCDKTVMVYLEAKAQFIIANSKKRPLVNIL